MQKQRFIAGFMVFAIGFAVFASGIYVFLYERAIRQANANYGIDKWLDARLSLERLVELPLSDPRVRYNLGIAYLRGAALDKAMAQFRRVAAESPDSKLRAQAYYLMAWTKVLEAHSYDVSYYYRYRTDTANNYREALRYLEEVLRLDPSNKDAKNLYERIRHLFKQLPPEDRKPRQNPASTPGIGGREPKP